MIAKRLFGKNLRLVVLFLGLLIPFFSLAAESVDTGRVQASVQDNGNWELTDSTTQITWHGEWIANHLMKVTGSDNSCFIIGENQDGMVQLNCQNLQEISILLSY